MHPEDSNGTPARTERFLSALLSQVLVAFTLEVDDEFELRMRDAGHPGISLSLNLWANLIRFIGDEGITVRDLAAAALATESCIKFQLGCLERWRLATLHSSPNGDRMERREGWGSGRGIRGTWTVRLTARGMAANSVWPELPGIVESRWEIRYGGDEIANLRQLLQQFVDTREVELPRFLPFLSFDRTTFPNRFGSGRSETDDLSSLLSRILIIFRLEFEQQSKLPLELCANTLRILGSEPIKEAEIPRLTGGSPEVMGIGWQTKPYVVVTPDPSAKRGKVVSLSAQGVQAKKAYEELNERIERGWELRFGTQTIQLLRESLLTFFEPDASGRARISQGLIPSPGTARAGHPIPSLGRREVAAAAKQRARDKFAQSRSFVDDPWNTLPHYPVWDMNRGYGP